MRISRHTRVAGVAFVLAGSLFLSACGGDSDEGDKKANNVITVYGTEPAQALIPANTNEVGGGDPLDNIFAGLVAYATDGTMSNEVAESIEPDADNKVWTVKLKDWKFTDGTPVTAESFVKAWSYAADKENALLNAYWYKDIVGTYSEGEVDAKGNELTGLIKDGDSISGLKVVDEKTFTITLKEAIPDYPIKLGYTAFMPLPDAAYGSDGKITKEYGQAPIGNGPYKLTKSGWEHNKRISLEPNPDYNGEHKPVNDGLVFQMYTGAEPAYLDVQSGILDVLDQVPPAQLTTFKKDTKVAAHQEPGSVFQSVTIPERLKHFGGEEGKLRRKALSYAIDRPLIAEKIFQGVRTPAKDFTSPLMAGYTDQVPGNEVINHDPAKAKELWAEADKIAPFTGKFKIAYNSDGAGHKEWVEAATNQISKTLGIDAEPKAYAQFSTLRQEVEANKIDVAFRTGWQADYPSALNYLQPIFGTGGSANDGDWSNKKFDQLLNDASKVEGDERAKLVTEAQAILFEELPAIPLFYYDATAVTSKGLKDFNFNWKMKPDYYKLTK